MRKPSRGFTLIELIVVILILGILAAVAAPRFVDIASQARTATLNGLKASVISAATLANALQLASNLGTASPVTVNGVSITMVQRYPSAASISNTIQADAGVFSSSVSGTTTTFQVIAATTPAQCQFTYTEAAAGAAPVITPTTTGC